MTDPIADIAAAAAWLAARIAFADAELARPDLPGEDCPATHVSALIRIRPSIGVFRPYGDADIHVDQLRALLAERDALLAEVERLRIELPGRADTCPECGDGIASHYVGTHKQGCAQCGCLLSQPDVVRRVRSAGAS